MQTLGTFRRHFVLILLLLIGTSLLGCMAEQTKIQPITWTAEGVTFDSYHSFELTPMANVSTDSVPDLALQTFNDRLRTEFERLQLNLAGPDQDDFGILTVRLELTEYNINQRINVNENSTQVPTWGWSRVAKCVVLARLINKTSGKTVAELMTFTKRGVKPAFKNPEQTHQWLARLAAEEVAREIAKVVQPEGKN